MVNNDTGSTCTMLFNFTSFNTFKLSVSIRKKSGRDSELAWTYFYAHVLSYTHIAQFMS